MGKVAKPVREVSYKTVLLFNFQVNIPVGHEVLLQFCHVSWAYCWSRYARNRVQMNIESGEVDFSMGEGRKDFMSFSGLPLVLYFPLLLIRIKCVTDCLACLIFYLWRNQSSNGFHFRAWSSSNSGGSTQWKRIVSVSRKSKICFTWIQQRWCMLSLLKFDLTSLGLSSRCGLSRHVFTRPFMCICSKSNYFQQNIYWSREKSLPVRGGWPPSVSATHLPLHEPWTHFVPGSIFVWC